MDVRRKRQPECGSESESTNDTRAGLEFAMLKRKLYLGAEMYYMHVGFTKRQKIDQGYH